MKLCITSTGNTMTSAVDPRFGRAPYFMLIDTETDQAQAIENTAVADAQGAGIGAARIMLDQGVEALLTGHLGPNAQDALRGSGIQLIEGVSGEMNVEEALNHYRDSIGKVSPQKSDETSPQTTETGQPGTGRGPGMGAGRGLGGGGRGMGGRGMGGGGGRGMGGGRRRR